jgi:hypothetical protein
MESEREFVYAYLSVCFSKTLRKYAKVKSNIGVASILREYENKLIKTELLKRDDNGVVYVHPYYHRDIKPGHAKTAPKCVAFYERLVKTNAHSDTALPPSSEQQPESGDTIALEILPISLNACNKQTKSLFERGVVLDMIWTHGYEYKGQCC